MKNLHSSSEKEKFESIHVSGKTFGDLELGDLVDKRESPSGLLTSFRVSKIDTDKKLVWLTCILGFQDSFGFHSDLPLNPQLIASIRREVK